jgi:ParB family chromosome partitioning protein
VSKGNQGFGAQLTSGLDDQSALDEVSPSADIMASRSQALARIATGKVVTDRTEFVDPARCRPWRLHNRDLDHLNEESCRDLIDAFLSAKRQRIPAIVRRIANDPDFDYEIVAGVRRWWTVKWLRANHHPEFDYLVTVQRIDDEEAFRVSDIENRSRKDISDWERAQEYTRALAEFYGGSQSQMAQHIAISKSWLSRLIDVARLPEQIVGAFGDRHDITVRIARDLKPLASDPQALARMTDEAAAIIGERADDRKPSGIETAKRLIRATTAPGPQPKKSRKATSTMIRTAKGKPLVEYQRGRGGVALTLLTQSGASRKEVDAALATILDQHWPPS